MEVASSFIDVLIASPKRDGYAACASSAHRSIYSIQGKVQPGGEDDC